MNLFLDDTRHPKKHYDYLSNTNGFGELYITEQWINVTTLRSFKQAIEHQGLPERISFDHDLGEDEHGNIRESGMDCAKWLIEYCLDNDIKLTTEFKVHSSNPEGCVNIRSILNNFIKHQK